MARYLIAREVIMIDDLRWIETLARLALVLIVGDLIQPITLEVAP